MERCVCVSASPSLPLSDHASFRVYSLKGISLALNTVSYASPHGGFNDERIIQSRVDQNNICALTIPEAVGGIPLEEAIISTEPFNKKTAEYFRDTFYGFADGFQGEIDQVLIDENKEVVSALVDSIASAHYKDWGKISEQIQRAAAGFYKDVIEIVGRIENPTVLDAVRFIATRRGFTRPILAMPPVDKINFNNSYSGLGYSGTTSQMGHTAVKAIIHAFRTLLSIPD